MGASLGDDPLRGAMWDRFLGRGGKESEVIYGCEKRKESVSCWGVEDREEDMLWEDKVGE